MLAVDPEVSQTETDTDKFTITERTKIMFNRAISSQRLFWTYFKQRNEYCSQIELFSTPLSFYVRKYHSVSFESKVKILSCILVVECWY